jgi:hypothetical protein
MYKFLDIVFLQPMSIDCTSYHLYQINLINFILFMYISKNLRLAFFV